MINIGKYIEIAINWLTEHFARFFDVINDGVGGFIDTFPALNQANNAKPKIIT